jgi:acylglycerol lipase
MDPRGFGHSQGKRAYIESEETYIEDFLTYADKIQSTFGETPRLSMGYSLGGMAAVKLSLAKPGYFKGMGLITPYMGLADRI